MLKVSSPTRTKIGTPQRNGTLQRNALTPTRLSKLLCSSNDNSNSTVYSSFSPSLAPSSVIDENAPNYSTNNQVEGACSPLFHKSCHKLNNHGTDDDGIVINSSINSSSISTT